MGLVAGQDGAAGYEPVQPRPGRLEPPVAALFRRRSAQASRRGVLHLQTARDAPVPPDLASWYTERGFHFYIAALSWPGRARGTAPVASSPGGPAPAASAPAASSPGGQEAEPGTGSTGAPGGPAPGGQEAEPGTGSTDAPRGPAPDGPDAEPGTPGSTDAPGGAAASGRSARRARTGRRGRKALVAAFAELDARCAHLRAEDGIDNVIVTAHGEGALAAALWCAARPAGGQADALILYAPDFAGALRHGGLDIACPVLVIGGAGGQARRRRWPRRRADPAATIPLGRHVTWLHPADSEARPDARDAADRSRFFDEMGRWLGAYMYGQVRDQLL
jgi:hypothetical protein